MSDRRLTVRMIVSELNLSHRTVHDILTEQLCMRQISAKLVPKETHQRTEGRPKECVPGASWRRRNDGKFFKHVITGDESWIFECDPETKRQSSGWHASNWPRPKKARMSKYKSNPSSFVFSTVKVSFMTNLAPQGQTVNQQYYREVLERLRQRVHRVRPETADTWMLHHHNSPCHTAISVNEFLTNRCIPAVPQPPYSSDLSTCDFFLFPKLKFHLKSRHFGTVDNIQKALTNQLRAIPHEDFQHCHWQWQQRLRRCVAFQGNCYEGGNVDL